jgi:hypothetical protein
MASEFATYLIRSLLSEGRLRYETVEKTKDGLVPRVIEREGPTGLIATTTSLRLHPENKSALSRRVAGALDGGYLKNQEERKGRPARRVLGDPLPANRDVLPRPDRLSRERLHGCTADPGDKPPPVPVATFRPSNSDRERDQIDRRGSQGWEARL